MKFFDRNTIGLYGGTRHIEIVKQNFAFIYLPIEDRFWIFSPTRVKGVALMDSL
jgi:hypothetical protein